MPSANLDTSVLVNYLRIQLDEELDVERLEQNVQDSESTRDLLEDDNNHCVIGGKVDDEFEGVCDRHHDIYQDILKWVTDNPDASLVEYDLPSRDVRASDNDVEFFRFEVQFKWGEDEKNEQLSDFRRLKQNVKTVEKDTRDLVDKAHDQYHDRALADELEGLDLNHDTGVVVDAVEIADRDGICLLVSADSGLTDQEAELNERIEAAGRMIELDVVRPSEV